MGFDWKWSVKSAWNAYPSCQEYVLKQNPIREEKSDESQSQHLRGKASNQACRRALQEAKAKKLTPREAYRNAANAFPQNLTETLRHHYALKSRIRSDWNEMTGFIRNTMTFLGDFAISVILGGGDPDKALTLAKLNASSINFQALI